MRIVLQRVREASVEVDGRDVARIGAGLLALVGVTHGDSVDDAASLATKTAALRLFPSSEADAEESGDPRPFDRSVRDLGGSVLVVSQFTLHGEVRRGNRPSWSAAAPGANAEPLVEAYTAGLREAGVATKTGVFGAEMRVSLVNDGPVTLVIDSADLTGPRREG